MSTFLSLFSLSHIRDELIRTVRRFPLSSIFIVIVTILSCYMVYEDYLIDKTLSDILMRIIVTCVMAFLLTLAMTLALERGYAQRTVYVLASVTGIGFWIFYYFTLGENPFDTTESATLIFMTLFGFSAFLFFAPYSSELYGPRYKEGGYVKYFYHIAMILLTSGIVGGAVMALGSIALWSIDTLLYTIDSEAYGYLASIAFAFIAPFFALARIPLSSDIGKEQGIENMFFTFLVKYVGLPFIALYFLILYAYTVKVLMNYSDWPKGQVSWMVIGFSVFGYILYIFSYPHGTPDGLIQRVRRYFPFAVIPQVFMLFYAIYLRIAQYDLTMNRYFVFVFGLWLLGISIYYSFAKSIRLVYLPVSLALITLLISLGPWSVYQLPVSRQYDRLIRNLESAQIYSRGIILPLAKVEDISGDLSNEIYEGIRYVCGFDNCLFVKKLFAKELEEGIQKQQQAWMDSEKIYQLCLDKSEDASCSRREYSKELSQWQIQDIVAKAIRVAPRSSFPTTSRYISFDTAGSQLFPIDIRGYDQILMITSDKPTSTVGLTAYVDIPTATLTISGQSGQLDSISLSEFFGGLLEKEFVESSDITLPPGELILSLSGKKYDTKIIFTGLRFKNPRYTSTDPHDDAIYDPLSANGYVLIRKK